MAQVLSDFLRQFHREMYDGLLAADTQSELVTLKVDSLETEFPLDIQVGGQANDAYRSITVKPPVASLALRNEFRFCRMRIHWTVEYHG